MVVVPIHWSGNWGCEVSAAERAFAHRLINEGGADLVHGHLSYQPRGIDVYKGKATFYRYGDSVRDCESIGGDECYRPDLVVMYFATVNAASGRIERLHITPMQTRGFRLVRAAEEDAGRLLNPAMAGW